MPERRARGLCRVNVLALRCAHRVPKRRRANMKTAIYLSKHRYGIGAGGGTRTLHSYLISELKTCRPV